MDKVMKDNLRKLKEKGLADSETESILEQISEMLSTVEAVVHLQSVKIKELKTLVREAYFEGAHDRGTGYWGWHESKARKRMEPLCRIP